MKRLLKKRYLIPLAAVVVLAIGGGVAAAVWSTTATSSAGGVYTATPGLTTGFYGSPWALGTTYIYPGATFTEVITLTNTGQVPFSSITMSDTLSANSPDIGQYLKLDNRKAPTPTIRL